MKKRIAAKLRGRAGESIAETLVAVLISALALVMLAGAISAAANVITRSRTAVNEYNEDTVVTIQNGWKEQADIELKKQPGTP